MSPKAQRAAVLGLAVLVAIVAFLVLRPGDDEDDDSGRGTPTAQPAPTTTGESPPTTPEQAPEAQPKEPQVPLIRVEGGRAAGGVQTIEAKKGETIRFRVQTETPQEVHVHGYDLTEKTSGGGEAVEFRFKAAETGIFEVEIHGTHTQIGELKVEP